MLTITLHSDYIASILGVAITNTFFTSAIAILILAMIALLYTRNGKSHHIFWKFVRSVLLHIFSFIDGITHDRTLTKKVFPLIATLFLFIGTANLMELFPGFLGSFFVHADKKNLPLFRSPTSDLTTTLALAIISVSLTQIFSVQLIGFKNYLGRFFNFSSFTGFMQGFFELLSESIKLLSFSFRLFGNVFAGEVLLLVAAFLFPYVIPIPFMILEIFVGLIQAFIFAMLTLAFISQAVSSREAIKEVTS